MSGSALQAGANSVTATFQGSGTYPASTSSIVTVIVTSTGVTGSATFIGTDTTTQGIWTPNYGSDGHLIANDADLPPAYATVSFSGDTPHSWARSTSDRRTLQTASSAETRIPSTYYAAGSFKINVNLTDGDSHQIALYLLDWDTSARSETISILDAGANAILSTQRFSSFHNGVYAVWNIKGNVVIQVTQTGGGNAVVSGIFFD